MSAGARLRDEWVWFNQSHRWALGELAIKVLVQDDEKWSSVREVNTRVMVTSGDDQGEPQRPDSLQTQTPLEACFHHVIT